MRTRLDLTGQTFGRLTALKDVGKAYNGPRLWRCQCACGNLHTVPSSDLRQGTTQSCGCSRQELARLARNRTAARKSMDAVKVELKAAKIAMERLTNTVGELEKLLPSVEREEK